MDWSTTDPTLSGLFLLNFIFVSVFLYLFYTTIMYAFFDIKGMNKAVLDIVIVIVFALVINFNVNNFSAACYNMCIKDSDNR